MRKGALQIALRAVRSQTASLLDRSLCSLLDKVSGTPQAAIGDRQTQKIALSGAIFCIYEVFIVPLQGNYKIYTYEKIITLSLCWTRL